MARFLRYCLLVILGLLTLFFIYPLLHELGHTIATWLLGGSVIQFSLYPQPHIDSFLPQNTAGIASISLAGLLFPLLVCLPFLKKRGYVGYCVFLVLLISMISGVIELCIALEYRVGSIHADDDIVIFLEHINISPVWAYIYTTAITFASAGAIVCIQPIALLQELADR